MLLQDSLIINIMLISLPTMQCTKSIFIERRNVCNGTLEGKCPYFNRFVRYKNRCKISGYVANNKNTIYLVKSKTKAKNMVYVYKI